MATARDTAYAKLLLKKAKKLNVRLSMKKTSRLFEIAARIAVTLIALKMAFILGIVVGVWMFVEFQDG